MFKLVRSDTHWLAFGVSAALIVARAVDVRKLAGFGAFCLTLHPAGGVTLQPRQGHFQTQHSDA